MGEGELLRSRQMGTARQPGDQPAVESDEDDEGTEIVFAVLPLEEGLAILDQA